MTEPTTEAEAMRAAIAARHARDYGQQPADDEVRQLVVHPNVWPHLTAWLSARGIDVNLMAPAGDDLATYVMSPRDLSADEPPTTPDALRRAQLRKLGRAMAEDGGETAAVRPQERPNTRPATPASPDTPNGPQTGTESLDGLREEIAAALTAWTAQAAPRGARLPEVVTANSRARADAVMAVVQPRLDAAHRRAEETERERDGLRHRVDHWERATLPDLQRSVDDQRDAKKRWRARAERAEAAEQRVRDLIPSLRADADHARTVGAHGLASGCRGAASRIETALDGTAPKEAR